MQGTSLTKEEREFKLYDEFDKFAYKKGESLRDFYLRFSLLLNDMNIYNMKLKQFQVNTKSLNTLPSEWSKFVTDVKLVRDLHTTNVDQLHAYLGQHEYHANESSQYGSHAQSSTPPLITYSSDDFQSSVHHNVYNPSSSIPQVEYAPTVHQQSDFYQLDTGLIIPVFQKGRQNSLTVGTSRPYTSGPSGNNSWKQRTVICYNCKGEAHMSKQCKRPKRKRDEAWFKDKIALMVNLSHYGSDNLAEVHNPDNVTNNVINQAVQNSNFPAQQDALFLSVIEQLKTQVVKYTKNNQDNKSVNETLTVELERYKDQVRILKEGNNKEESRNIDRELALEKQAQQLEPKLYDGYVIQKMNAIVISDSEETLMLEDESHSKMLQKQKDPMMSEKKVNTKPVDYAALNQPSQDFETQFVPQTKLYAEQVFWS
uniref:CCHC-type domain-containing protein n=1 Tax=Tanacetum cinerariifolium TaxID=118510 RepID=A0A6L2NKY1_TANCI|nr:hypothetical protein [Tanacetum cinerariifolium]